MTKHQYLIVLLSVVAWALPAPASAQRKPDAPVEKPPEAPANVTDEEFLKAWRDLGYGRLAIVVHVHASDVVEEIRTRETKVEQSGEGGVRSRQEGLELKVIPKEDQTNAWRIARAMAARLHDCFSHREIRASLVELDDLGPERATELRALALRDEQGAARRIGAAVRADLVIMFTLTRAVQADAGGARYGADYLVADVKRDQRVASWSWDLKPDREGAYPAPLLGINARHAAKDIRDKLVDYASQARAAGGQTLRYQTLRFFGLDTDQLNKLNDALKGVSGVKILNSEYTTEHETPVARIEVESTRDLMELAPELQRRLSDAIGKQIEYKTIQQGTLDFTLRKP